MAPRDGLDRLCLALNCQLSNIVASQASLSKCLKSLIISLCTFFLEVWWEKCEFVSDLIVNSYNKARMKIFKLERVCDGSYIFVAIV